LALVRGSEVFAPSLPPTDEFFATGSRGRRISGDNMEIAAGNL